MVLGSVLNEMMGCARACCCMKTGVGNTHTVLAARGCWAGQTCALGLGGEQGFPIPRRSAKLTIFKTVCWFYLCWQNTNRKCVRTRNRACSLGQESPLRPSSFPNTARCSSANTAKIESKPAEHPQKNHYRFLEVTCQAPVSPPQRRCSLTHRVTASDGRKKQEGGRQLLPPAPYKIFAAHTYVQHRA